MEIKSELKQPYTENERISFIVEQNHNLGYEIRQVEITYEVEEDVPHETTVTEIIEMPIFDEEGNPVLDEEGNQVFKEQEVEKSVIKYTKETVQKTGYNLEAWGYTEKEKQEQERESIKMLSMTKREMFLGLYQAKQITPDMLKTQITDPAALIEFEYANDYYRGNPLIDVIGRQLGFTSEQLDKFFISKDYHELLEIPAEEQASDAVDTTEDNIKESEAEVADTTDTTE